jgi:hypothetical protein
VASAIAQPILLDFLEILTALFFLWSQFVFEHTDAFDPTVTVSSLTK